MLYFGALLYIRGIQPFWQRATTDCGLVCRTCM